MDYREDESLCESCGQPLDKDGRCECHYAGVDTEDAYFDECIREQDRERASLQLENYLRRCGS